MDGLKETLSCPICYEYCESAVECSSCYHVFCQKCVNSTYDTKCPLCRQTAHFKASFLARRMINMLPTACKNCKVELCIGDLETHLQRCEFVKVKCPINGCYEQMKKSEFLDHFSLKHRDVFMEKLNQILDIMDRDGVNTPEILSVKNYTIEPMRSRNSRIVRLGATGKYYCGSVLDGVTCLCCSGYCGVVDGCNCSSCMTLDVKSRNLPKGWLVNREGFAAKRSDRGKFYCGRRVLAPTHDCDGYCGPHDGPNCLSCMTLDIQTKPGGRYAKLIDHR